ncbi:MAG: TonB-dependent receptor [Tannerella sp.]|jgi:TonB-linked SusC/RagA family outer membrane protein|nr:TonB-dependent receptor [Tannerella sp.]
MTNKLTNGMKNAKLKKLVNIMTLSAFLLLMGIGTASARSGDSQETSELQQSKTQITGTIVDQTGEPVVGANVVEKGVATNGTITDVDGNFSLEVLPGATLSVSYIGYVTQEIAVGNRTELQIVLLEDTQALEEVIVIGYGVAKRQDFTGSVSSLRLENSPIALTANLNALEAIKGNVAGLDIGATNAAGGQPSMQLRGQKSISGSNDPLIVVDGVIYMGSLNDINPNDIAAYDILKDASSAAAYGSRSANGVIIITTKKGQLGKPLVTFNASGSMQQWQNRPEMMTSDQWAATVEARTNNPVINFMEPQEIERMNAGKETNWLDFVTRTGYIQDYQVAVSGAGDKMNYYVSTSYSDNQGIVIGDNYNRVSVLSKINTYITDWLQIGLDGAYTRSDYSGASASLSLAQYLPPYGVPYRDEEKKLLEKYPSRYSVDNPLWGVTNGSRDNADIRNNFRINAFAVVKAPWIEGLSYRFNYAGNLSKNQSSDFYYETHYVKEGEYNDPSRYTPEVYQTFLSSANGNINSNSTGSWLIDHILTYHNLFGKHTLDLTAVATRDCRDYSQVISRGSDFAANGNTVLGIDGLHKATVQKIELTKDRRTNIGYFGRASYSFDDRYFLTASYRRDGASVFGTENKWGNFAAAGFAWKVTSESFMKSVKNLNSLKLKVSFGKNGNQGLDPYGTLSTINNGASGGVRYEFGGSNILYGITAGTLGNASLGWESTSAWNTGFESAWLKNRIFLDADVYFSRTTDQIFDRTIPIMTGFNTMKSSMGEIGNSGIEVTLRTVNIENRDLNWTTGFTFWLSRNKLIHLYGDDIDGDGKEDDDIGNSRFIGKSLGAIYGFVQDGIVQEDDAAYIQANGSLPGVPKYKDLDGNGSIGPEDREILGYDRPNFKLNMSHTLTYKNWDLYAMLTGTFGGGGYYLKSNSSAYISNGGGHTYTNNIYIPWWTPENRSNIYPSPAFSGDGRFLGLQSRTFVRLQDVTLSYTFREPWVKNLRVQNLKIFLTGKNLFVLTNWEGGDPEVGAGVRAGDQPVMTSFSIGANISF